MKRIFIGFLTFIAILAASLGAFLFVSLIPFFRPIGFVAAAVVMLGLLCVAALMISFTYSRIVHNRLTRRVVAHGEVVAYLDPEGEWYHLSAEHVRAGVPRMLPAPDDEEPLVADDKTVIEMYRAGTTLQHIVKATGRTYYQVQKAVARAKENGTIS
jgi:hypothetical protein